MISIPRDAMVSIPGYESTFPQKINAAYAYGSTATAIKTVESYLNIPIDFYALVNMSGLEKMVTQVGEFLLSPPLTSLIVRKQPMLTVQTYTVSTREAQAMNILMIMGSLGRQPNTS
ncbi:LCP family protein [Leuconostoc mesenteroides]|nr:LCP family protein [Leuconostoc mesenteroides]